MSGWALTAVVLLMGMAIGSFLNVVIFRVPMGQSVVTPRSRCLSCGTWLSALDNIPVFSYIFLRGRCRHCGRPYSPRYMLVELITGLLAVVCLMFIGPFVYAITVFALLCVLIVIFFIDLDWMIIPDESVIFVAAVGVALNVLGIARGEAGQLMVFSEQLAGQTQTIGIPMSIVGIALGAGIFLLISLTAERILNKPALGGGDVKLAGAVGALLGPGVHFLVFFLYAVFIGAIVGVVAMAFAKRTGKSYIPFGPMLAISAGGMLLFPDEMTYFLIDAHTALLGLVGV